MMINPVPPPLDDGEQPTEPALKAGGWLAVITAAVTLATAFGLPINADQKMAIIGFLLVAAPVLTAVVVRRHVFSPETVRQLVLAERRRRPRTPGLMPHTPGGTGAGVLLPDEHHDPQAPRRPGSGPA